MTAIARTQLSRSASIERLAAHYADAPSTQLDEIAELLDDRTEALDLATALFTHDKRRRFPHAVDIAAALRQAGREDARHFEPQEPAPPPDQHPALDTSLALNNLGRLLTEMFLPPLARRAYALAVAFDTERFGPVHWRVARGLNRLGTVLHDCLEWDEALNTYERALRIDREYFGETHPTIARDCNNLALLLRDLGQWDNAQRLLDHAVSVAETHLGTDHPYTRIVHGNLWRLELERLGH